MSARRNTATLAFATRKRVILAGCCGLGFCSVAWFQKFWFTITGWFL